MKHLSFFKSLKDKSDLELTVSVLREFPLQYATTLGLDGLPQIRPIEFKFEEEGVLYLDTITTYTSYKELLKTPTIQLCVCDQETMTYIRLGGHVNFTQDEHVIDECFRQSPILSAQYSDHRELVIGYYLTDVWVEFVSFHEEIESRKFKLTNKCDV